MPTPKEVDILIAMSNTYKTGLVKYRNKQFDMYPPYRDEKSMAAAENNALDMLFGD